MPRTCAGGGGERGECLRACVHVCDLYASKCTSPTCGGAAPFPGTAPPPHLSLTARHCCRGKTSSMDGSATVGGASDPDAGRCTTIFSGCFCSRKGWGGKQGVLGSVTARCGAAQPVGPAAAPHGGPPTTRQWLPGLGRVAVAGVSPESLRCTPSPSCPSGAPSTPHPAAAAPAGSWIAAPARGGGAHRQCAAARQEACG